VTKISALKKILIIGVNSNVAARLALLYLQDKVEVFGVIRQCSNNVPAGVILIDYDEAVRNAKEFDLVYLIAAYIPIGKVVDTMQLIESNILLPAKVIRDFVDSRVVFTSSVAVYCNSVTVAKEDTATLSDTLYGQSKIMAERLIAIHPNSVVLRISSIYGPDSHNTSFVTRIINQANESGVITLFGDGQRKQNYIFIDDVVDYLYRAGLGRMKGNFLAVSEISYSNKQIADFVCKSSTGTVIEFKGTDDSPSFQYDNSLSRRVFDKKLNKEINKIIEELVNEKYA